MFVLDLLPSVSASLLIPVTIKEGGKLTNQPFLFACMLFICAGIVATFSLVGYTVFVRDKPVWDLPTRMFIFALLGGIGVFVSVWNFGRLLQKYNYSFVSIVYTIIVILGAFLIGIGLYKEPLSLHKVIGLAVLFAGLWLFYKK